MKYMLDTDICIYTIKRRPDQTVAFLSRHNVFAMAMNDDNMDLLNPQILG
ncbi:hypothetical protein [uncultured Desulfobacter sp.]|nr:hypothetical protein [uncultured Desulfobacter sp.]